MTNIDPQDSTDTRTPRQIAGAANGRLAAGAKSPEGLARSAANSTKHGLTANMSAKTSPISAADKPRNGVTILNECPGAFENLFEALESCFLPTDAHETILVKRMVQAEWLRQRAVHMETAALSEAMRQQAHPFHANTGSQALSRSEAEPLRAWHGFSKLGSANPAFANLQRYATTHARAYARAERELRDYRIAKAESIHPASPQLAPQPTLEPSPRAADDESTNRWRPLETREEPTEEPIEEPIDANEPETPDEPELTAAPEPTEADQSVEDLKTANCETKVTPPSDLIPDPTPEPQTRSTLSPPPASHL